MSAKKEQGVHVVNIGVLVDHEGAEDDLRDGSGARVLADGSHATVRPPYSNRAVDVAGDKAGPIGTEGEHSDWVVMDTLKQTKDSNLNIAFVRGR